MRTRPNLSSAQIDLHLQHQLSSGLSVSEYCQHHQLKVASFYNWRSTRRKRAGSGAVSDWVELTGLAQTGLKGFKPESVKASAPPVSNKGFDADITGNAGGFKGPADAVLVQLTLPGGLVLSIRPA